MAIRSLLASVVAHRRSRREREHAPERKRQATAPAGASSLSDGALGSAQFEKRDVRTHTTSEPLRETLLKIAKKLTNIDRMIVEEDLD
jgi:hypothetical protein